MAVHQKHGAMNQDKNCIKNKIGKLISKGQPDEAIELLCDIMELQNHPKLDLGWHLMRRLRKLREKEMKGIISVDMADLEESRFCDQILMLAKWVDEEENST